MAKQSETSQGTDFSGLALSDVDSRKKFGSAMWARDVREVDLVLERLRDSMGIVEYIFDFMMPAALIGSKSACDQMVDFAEEVFEAGDDLGSEEREIYLQLLDDYLGCMTRALNTCNIALDHLELVECLAAEQIENRVMAGGVPDKTHGQLCEFYLGICDHTGDKTFAKKALAEADEAIECCPDKAEYHLDKAAVLFYLMDDPEAAKHSIDVSLALSQEDNADSLKCASHIYDALDDPGLESILARLRVMDGSLG